jgi:hypothetical protein
MSWRYSSPPPRELTGTVGAYRGHVLAAQADPRLHHEWVALKHAHAGVVRRHHVGPQLLHDPQAQVVLARRAEAVAVSVVEVHLAQQLVYAHHLIAVRLFAQLMFSIHVRLPIVVMNCLTHLLVVHLFDQRVAAQPLCHLAHKPVGVLLADARELLRGRGVRVSGGVVRQRSRKTYTSLIKLLGACVTK